MFKLIAINTISCSAEKYSQFAITSKKDSSQFLGYDPSLLGKTSDELNTALYNEKHVFPLTTVGRARLGSATFLFEGSQVQNFRPVTG